MHDANARDNRTLYLCCLFLYMALGMLILTTNATLSSIIAENGWSDWQGGLLVTLQSTGSIVASLGAGLLLTRFGRKNTLLISLVLGTVGFVGIALSPTPFIMYPLIFLTGLFWGLENAVLNILVAEITDGNAARINLLHSMYAVGAVVAPLMVSAFLGLRLGWRPPVYIVSLMLAAGFYLTLRLPIPEKPMAMRAASGDAFRPTPRFVLATSMFFVYVGVEVAACAWLPTFLAEQNPFFVTVRPEVMLSLLWVLMIVGRLIVASVAARLDKSKLLLVESAGFLVGMLGLIFLVRSTPMVILSVAFMGLSMSAIYGTLIANNADLMTGSSIGPGLMLSGGGFGAAVIPLLASIVSDMGGIRLGMQSLLLLLAVLVCQSLLNRSWQRRREA